MPGDGLTPTELLAIEEAVGEASFLDVFESESSGNLVELFVKSLYAGNDSVEENSPRAHDQKEVLRVGLASLGAFLQSNVTGPVLERTGPAEAAFLSAFEHVKSTSPEVPETQPPLDSLRRECLRSLDIDGVSAYPYIPHIELFCLAKFIFTSSSVLSAESSESAPAFSQFLSWMRLRIHIWHYKLLAQPSLGSGSVFTKASRWTDVASLQELIDGSLAEAASAIPRTQDQAWPLNAHIRFRLEEASCHIMLGNDEKAKEALRSAVTLSGLTYALSGALGKRTRFQEKSTSQLVVLAKSRATSSSTTEESKGAPASLPLNDDTLLEKIDFSNSQPTAEKTSPLPAELHGLSAEDQPGLMPEDQIVLLTEATIRDTFSPADALTSEEILPFALRVIQDKTSNWQIYTQALLVRSRIELSRSRTIERAVLQMQAVVDQVIADMSSETLPDPPAITVTGASEESKHPTSFLPAPKPSDSAPARERLRYVDALASPPRWHLESELAHAWTAVGSLVSALEIFRRLRLWPEVALCLASTGATDDPDGRGSGGEEKAKAVIRWRLFAPGPDADDHDLEDASVDVSSLKASNFVGPERSPPPPNGPRLFCILADLENDASHYERAWELSQRRFARAQRSLGELYLRNQEWEKARDAYSLAVGVNRLSPELWSRLGDIELRLCHFPEAAEAFQRAIAAANNISGGDDARTWSNLGSALLSWYREVVQESKQRGDARGNGESEGHDDIAAAKYDRSPRKLLRDSLSAFKRGATLADSNWRIWDNVITLAASLTPEPDLDDVILGLRSIIRIRNTEEALDVDVLTLLVREVTKNSVPPAAENGRSEIYEPPKGTTESKVVSLFEDAIAPLITTDSACWSLISRLRAWRRDWAGALDAAEKAWRTAMSQDGWLTAADADAWDVVVQRTSELVAAYENYGDRVEEIGSRWKGKARSAVRSVLGKAKESWEDDERWALLKNMMEDLR
ncbi:hypothetical protein F4778DRAFT_390577 [Xylariomycetidae sp. FL2044]|nr:hypothetical protein F4778DRAFT_390577 [Xylariomycetidae sp. FL2044]